MTRLDRVAQAPQRWSLVTLVVAMVALPVLIVDNSSSEAATTQPSVLLLGDSTMAASVWYDEIGTTASIDVLRRNFNTDFDAESCRRLIGLSCTGFDRATGRRYKPPNVIEELVARRGQRIDAVVIMAGYDDGALDAGIDAVMAEANAQRIAHVVWMTYRTTTSYILPGRISASGLYERHNNTLRAALGRHPTLRLAEWDAFTAGFCNHPRTGSGAPGQRGAAVTQPCWFWWDGIHMTPAGAVGLTEYLDNELTSVLATELNPRCDVSAGRIGESATPTTSSPTFAEPGGLVATAPRRVLDTRANDADDPAHVDVPGAGRRLRVELSALAPPGATAVLANVTAVDACAAGFVTVHPCEGAVPETSSLNPERGSTVANATLTALGTDRALCLFSSVDTDLIVDITGWLTPDGARFTPVTPARLVDTRSPTSGLVVAGSRLAANEVVTVPLAAVGPIPADATGVWLGVVGAEPSGAGYISVSPCSTTASASSTGTTSTLNMDPGELGGAIVANAAVVALGSGSVCVQANVDTDVVIDLFGWFGPSGQHRVRANSPQRVVDTRRAPLGTAPLTGTMPLPSGSVADIVNITVVGATTAGFAVLHPCGAVPVASNVNMAPGVIRPSMGAAVANTSGQSCITTSVAADVVIDRLATLV
jgi:lysophospholipase L1-like esterase